MRHRFLLANYFLKKNLRSILSFSIILLIAMTLFISGVMVSTSVDKDYAKKFEDLNTADVSVVIPEFSYNEELLEKIRGTEGVSDVATARGILLNVPVKMNGMEQNQNQIFYRMADAKTISQMNIIERVGSESESEFERGIFVPYYIYKNSGMKVGDEFRFKADGAEYSFRVQGVVEEMEYGNYASGVIGEYLPEGAYQYLLEKNKDAEVRTLFVKTTDEERTLKEVTKVLNEEKVQILSKSRASTKKQARLSLPNILVLMLLAFGVIILTISLVVTRFKIKQTLEEDLANMGVLKSLGYKSGEIIDGIVLPYAIATIITAAGGVGLAVPVLGVLGEMISGQAGFVWEPKLNALVSIIIMAAVVLLVAVSTRMSARKIRKLKPIEAIRGISESKKIRNPFPVAKTGGGVNFILALKNFANSVSENFLLGIVLFLNIILASFVVTLFFNVNVNPENFVDTLVEEHPTVLVSMREDIKDEVAKDYRAIYYDESGESILDGNAYKTFVAESFEGMRNDLVYEGANPKDASEVAVGSAIQKKYGYKIGDKIKLSKGDTTQEYTISGFVQSVNNSGEVIEMTVEGYKLLNEKYKPSILYVYLDNESEESATKLIDELSAKFGDKIGQTVNYVTSMNSAASTFLGIVEIMTIVILIIAVLVIYLVLNILLTSLIMKKKQDLGVLKAVGFRTRQLVLQIVGGFMPSTIVFSLIGAVASSLCMSAIFKFIFGMVGAYKVSFEYPVFVFFGVAGCLIIGTILIGIFLAKKIKRITVYSLIKE